MIIKFLKAVAAFAALSLSLTTFGQVTVLDLTEGNAPAADQTWLLGNWDSQPVDQRANFQRYWDRSNDDASGVYFDIIPSLNLSGLDLLSLTARINGDHTGLTLTVTLFDTNYSTASSIFDLSAFDSEFFTTQTAFWTASDAGFDPSAIMGVQFSGLVTGGTDTLNFDAQRVQALSSVPEPSTYAAAGAGGLLLLAAFRRRRRQA